VKVTLSITLTSPKDRGVVAFSLLAIHVALQTELWGANQHESHWVFNISTTTPQTSAYDDHRRHAQHQQGELRHPALIRHEPRAALH
jgi:hypothetical protein